jgi:hypothetical protein
MSKYIFFPKILPFTNNDEKHSKARQPIDDRRTFGTKIIPFTCRLIKTKIYRLIFKVRKRNSSRLDRSCSTGKLRKSKVIKVNGFELDYRGV